MDLQLTPKLNVLLHKNPLEKKQASKRVRVLKREIFYHGNVSSSFVIPVHPKMVLLCRRRESRSFCLL